MKIIELIGIHQDEHWLKSQQSIVESIVDSNLLNIVQSALQYAHDLYEIPTGDLAVLLQNREAVLRVAEFCTIAGILHGINALEIENKNKNRGKSNDNYQLKMEL